MNLKSFNERKRRRLKLKVKCGIIGPIGKTGGYLLNISEYGLSIQLAKDIQVKKGDNVKVVTEHTGCLFGEVVWQRRNLAGIALEVNSNSYAQTLAIIRAEKTGQLQELEDA